MGATQFEAPQWECFEWLKSDTVGRLCVVDRGFPLAFPVNYKVIRDREECRVIFRTVPHSAVGRYQGPASLEVDQIDSTRLHAWSVIVRGHLCDIVDPADRADTSPLVTEGRNRWKVLQVSSISGRRFTSRTAREGFSVDWQSAI